MRPGMTWSSFMLPTTLSQHFAISRIVSALAIKSLQDAQL